VEGARFSNGANNESSTFWVSEELSDNSLNKLTGVISLGALTSLVSLFCALF